MIKGTSSDPYKNVNLSPKANSTDVNTPKATPPAQPSVTSKISLWSRININFQRLRKYIDDLPIVPKAIVITLPFLVTIALIAYFTYTIITDIPNISGIKIANNVISGTESDTLGNLVYLNKISNPKVKESPINGILLTQAEYDEMIARPPVAVMIENLKASRPQSALIKADVVYEALAEGGITRFMAIYWTQSPDKIGPVRSARKYYVDWAAAYDPIYVHIGGAKSTGNTETDAYSAIWSYDIMNVDAYSTWRDPYRESPHNAYTSIEKTMEYAATYGYSEYNMPTSWKFKSDAPLEERGGTKSVDVKFISGYYSNGEYDASWTYDKDSNTYSRYHAGILQTDLETGEAISPKVLIVEYCDFKQTFDSGSRVTLKVIGSGQAKVFMDGKVIEATWSKSTASAMTIYTNTSTGKEIEFDRGQIWVMGIPADRGAVEIVN